MVHLYVEPEEGVAVLGKREAFERSEHHAVHAVLECVGVYCKTFGTGTCGGSGKGDAFGQADIHLCTSIEAGGIDGDSDALVQTLTLEAQCKGIGRGRDDAAYAAGSGNGLYIIGAGDDACHSGEVTDVHRTVEVGVGSCQQFGVGDDCGMECVAQDGGVVVDKHLLILVDVADEVAALHDEIAILLNLAEEFLAAFEDGRHAVADVCCPRDVLGDR